MGTKTDVSTVQYLETWRPWLSLYGTRIRPVAPVGSISRLPPVKETSLLHRMLPDELLFEVFLRAAPYALGQGACVCRKWRYAIMAPTLWRRACLKAWQAFGYHNEFIVQHSYNGSWRKMWLERPRLRFDGLYVSRNTYIRTGIAEWKITNPVHLVCYYRYMRFYPSGKCLYKISPNRLKEVAKVIQGHGSKADSVFFGRYTLVENQVEAAVLYPGRNPTVLRIRLRLRGTTPGANNRLDLLSLVTSGMGEDAAQIRDEDVLDAVEGWEEDESHDPDVPAVSHRRGMASLVFVPFEEVETSVLNLPVEKMDYFVPG